MLRFMLPQRASRSWYGVSLRHSCYGVQRLDCATVLGAVQKQERLEGRRVFSSETSKHFVIKVPVMGEAVQQGDLVEWLKNCGDIVAEDDVVCVLETDKVTVDVHSPVAGSLVSQLAQVNETVRTDQGLAEIAVGVQGNIAENAKESISSLPKAESDGDQAKQPTAELQLKPPREPSIRFRHGKRSSVDADTIESKNESAAESLILPANYGRLPSLNETESLSLMLGGAAI